MGEGCVPPNRGNQAELDPYLKANFSLLRYWRGRAVADFFEICLFGVGQSVRTGAMLLVKEGLCEFVWLRALLVKTGKAADEQPAKHVRRPLGDAAYVNPNFGQAFFV